MTGVLLVGAGEVGRKHLAALSDLPGITVLGVADPGPSADLPRDVPTFVSWMTALAALAPDLVVVATPPGIALAAARDAAASGAVVLVEKPVTLDPARLHPQPGDERISVAFQPHFAPGLDVLLARPPAVDRAEVLLTVNRDAGYYRGWRRTYASAGGVLHQQAVHGLALALRLLPGDVESADARVVHRRLLAEIEDRVTATITLTGGRTLHVDAGVDHPGRPRHDVVLHLAGGQRLAVHGRNLEAGLGATADAPSHEELRRRMYRAALAGHPAHPCLFPLSALRRPLEVIDRVYRDAVRDTPAATA